MEVKGRIAQVFDVRNGVSAKGTPWMSQDFIVEYFWWPNQTIPSRMLFNLFGEDRIRQYEPKVGDEVKVRYHVEAREYNGRYYNEVRCDGIERVGAVAAQPQPAVKSEPQPTPTAINTTAPQPQQANDDLPF